jgi:predicted N-formylglutamate amidohydrolase
MKKVFSAHEFDKKYCKRHIIFICDHASNHIPKSYKSLGLSNKVLNSHISWDIGAKDLCIKLSKELEQSYFCANFSRLLIDPNRHVFSNDLIVSDSWGQSIPGNSGISLKNKKKRIENFYKCYHYNLKRFIKKKKTQHKKIYLVAIHSFTKKTSSENRGIKIGLLYNKNIQLLLYLQKKLQEKNIHFGRNFPYSGFFYNYTLDKHSNNGLLDNISIEIRNDLICKSKGIKKYSDILIKIFESLINDR